MSTQNLAAEMGASKLTENASGSSPIPPLVRARIAAVRVFLVAWSKAFSMSGLYKLGQFFGTLEYLTDYKRRRRVYTKLGSLFKDEFPRSWYRKTTWRYFMRVRCDKMFYTIMDRIPRGKLMNRIKMFGREDLDAAIAKNRGVYVALCHFGAHHVAGLMAALLGYRLAGVRDPKESHVRRYIQDKYRETFPEVAEMQMFHTTSFPRAIYRQFKEKKIVASLLDVDRSRGDNTRTMPVTIFGETREFLTGPVQIAVRCGAPTLQGFVESRKNFYYRLIVTPLLIVPEGADDEDGVISRVLQRYADGVEAFARRHPDHLMNI
jgi:lauroyl/myristoyl acyltransferase